MIQLLKSIIDNKEFSANDETYPVTGSITKNEVDFFETIIQPDSKILDIGVGKGVSTVLFSILSKEQVIGIDPFQIIEHKQSCFRLSEKIGTKTPKIIIKKSIEAKSDLSGLTFDLIFVDGYHTFDSTIIDFLVTEDHLKVGGVIAFHDCYYLSKQKVLKYILANQDYQLLNFKPTAERGVIKRLLRFGYHSLVKYRTPLWSSVKLLSPAFSDSSIVALKKISNKKQAYSEFNDF